MAKVSTVAKPRIKVSAGVDVNKAVKALFEGASTGYRLGKKGLSAGPINADLPKALQKLRKRTIHMVRNNPYATAAVESYVANLVGNGMVAKWANPRLQQLWDLWVNHCDADGIDNFYALQGLAARTQYQMGEALTRRRIRQSGRHPELVPLKLQLLHPDQLDEHHSDPNQNIYQGIQLNRVGERTHYHIWPSLAGEQAIFYRQRVRVPAGDMLHLYRRLEPGQLRGLPELTPILARLYEIDELQDATLVKAKTAALFAWIVKRNSKSTDLPQERNTIGHDQGESSDDGVPITEVRAGGVHYLDDDEEVQFSEPDGIGEYYVPFLKSELRASAKAAGLTYDQLTGDLEGVSYNSLRAALIEFRRRIEMLQCHLLIARWCHPVARWFAETAVLAGLVELPDFWTRTDQYLPIWRTPKWEWVDPLKDIMADILEVRAGFMTREDKVAERQGELADVDRQLAKEQGSDLVLDSDPSKTNKEGKLQELVKLAGEVDRITQEQED